MLTDAKGNHMKDKTTRTEPCKRTNVIEPRIRPLVSALNATGLVTTFSSCEGHFGRVDKESLNVRENANVRFVAGHVFVFQIEPFDPHLTSRSKRRNVDLVIQQTAKSVRAYVRGLRRKLASLEK